MNRQLVGSNFFFVPLMVIFLAFIALECSPASAQDATPNDGTINPRFAKYQDEISAVCGSFLPNQITGITEYMSLCGGRFGFKVGPNTRIEPMFLAGAGRAQRYMIGSLSFRGDVQLDEFIASYYAGADVHYATSPIYTAIPTGETTAIYFGGHVGGALWWELSENLFLRGDLKFNLNPGTSLFVGLSLGVRFNAEGASGGGNAPANP